MVEDIVQLLDSWPALAGRPVALVGHSMGGGVACEVALARPDRVAAVVLEDPALGPSDGTTAGHETAVRREWGAAQVAQLTRYAVDPAFATAKVAQLVEPPAVEAHEWLAASTNRPRGMTAGGRIRPERPWRQAVAELTVPTLVVSGTREVIWEPRSGRPCRRAATP